jgi:hypothetical protein
LKFANKKRKNYFVSHFCPGGKMNKATFSHHKMARLFHEFGGKNKNKILKIARRKKGFIADD